jgi:hypothetical protein
MVFKCIEMKWINNNNCLRNHLLNLSQDLKEDKKTTPFNEKEGESRLGKLLLFSSGLILVSRISHNYFLVNV